MDKRKTVLVVDDTPANIDILIDILSDNYDIEVATDGHGALESVIENIPDLILLDVMMPGMDGYEVCETLKKEERTKSIPIIFISALSEITDEVRGFKAGAIDYISKPFSPLIVKHRVDAILKLEEKTHELSSLAHKLSKYLSPQVYVSIFRGEQDVVIESKRKKMTIFFSDIVNFTSTTEGMETEDLTDLLNSYLEEMSRIAIKYGGTIDKFIGDAILIFFGDPLSLGIKDDAKSCVSMAIEMRERLKELQEKWYSFGIQNPFKVRAGITTGYCTVGNFGSKNRMDYTIIGNQVNIASRLESYAKPDQILISHETWSLINDEIKCLKEGQIRVKGINYPIETYQVMDFIKNVTENSYITTAEQYMEKVITIDEKMTVLDLYALFEADKELNEIVITNNNLPLGIIYKSQLLNLFKDDYIKSDLMKKEISVIQYVKTIIVDKLWPIKEVLERFILRDKKELYDPVLVTDEDKLAGIIPAYKLLKNYLGGDL